jgi:hypothetical protein
MYELVRVRSRVIDVARHSGEFATYTFAQTGEFFSNDCFSPRPTGKVEVIQ